MSIIIAGYIKSAELKHTPGGDAVCDMQFAFSQRSGQGNVLREIDIRAWGLTAESAAQSYASGGYVIIKAAYRDDVVEGTDGKEHSHSLLVSRIYPGSEGLELNEVALVGAVGADSTGKTFSSGAVKANNLLAVRRTKEVTDWINLEGWGKDAETMERYVVKGKLIAVEGSFKIDTWADKTTGAARLRPFVVIDKLTLLGGKATAPAGEAEDSGTVPSPEPAVSKPRPTKIPF